MIAHRRTVHAVRLGLHGQLHELTRGELLRTYSLASSSSLLSSSFPLGSHPRVADTDSPTCRFAEFSLKWRSGFSHLRGGSSSHTVVRDFGDDRGRLDGLFMMRCETSRVTQRRRRNLVGRDAVANKRYAFPWTRGYRRRPGPPPSWPRVKSPTRSVRRSPSSPGKPRLGVLPRRP